MDKVEATRQQQTMRLCPYCLFVRKLWYVMECVLVAFPGLNMKRGDPQPLPDAITDRHLKWRCPKCGFAEISESIEGDVLEGPTP